jgi:hypothetical protein
MAKHTHNWTPEKIAEFSYSALLDMKQKAIANDAHDVLAMCEFELSKRPPPPPVDPNARKLRASGTRKNGRAPSIVSAEKELITALEKLGRSLLEKYDLSVETARKLSKGFKYAPHSFDGKAKVGGAKLLGRVAVNKALSYRLKEDVFAIAGVLEHDAPAESMTFMVLAPKEFLANPIPLIELIPSLKEGDSLGNISVGQHFNNFDDAAELYASIIERIAPKKD